MNNISFVGFMGSGKTSVSKMLAERLKRERVSTDDLIEQREARKISDIFRDSGEPYFREIEKKIVAEVARRQNLIIDCGGGVVLNADNMKALKAGGKVIYLQSSPEFIYQCIKGETHRPLLAVEDPQAKIRELLAKRAPFYEQADFIINGDRKTIAQICDELLAII